MYIFITSSVHSTCTVRYALVICNHGPPSPREKRGHGLLVQQIPSKSPTLRGQLVGKTTVDLHYFPPQPAIFHFTALFVYIKQTPGISPALPWQNFGQSTDHFHGYPQHSPGGGGGGGGAWLQMTCALYTYNTV